MGRDEHDCVCNARDHRVSGIFRWFVWNRCHSWTDRWIPHRIYPCCIRHRIGHRNVWQKHACRCRRYDRRHCSDLPPGNLPIIRCHRFIYPTIGCARCSAFPDRGFYQTGCRVDCIKTGRSGDPVIELAGISFSYPERPVLRDVSLCIGRGEYLGITGDNGSGKTTLVKLLNGLLLSQEGEVTVDGTPTSDRESLFAIRRSVGIVFQNPDAQAVGETVEEDIVFGLENIRVPSSEIDRRIEKYLGMLGIPELRDRNVSLLSGGQKQLVNIAAVMAMEPAYIVFDEALSMLDASNRRNVLLRMSELTMRGISIIQITHNPKDLGNCHRVITISEGRISGTVGFSSEIAMPSDSNASVDGRAITAECANETNEGKGEKSAVVNWMHNTATDIDDINRKYNPVDFTACMGSIRPQRKKGKRCGEFGNHRTGHVSGVSREGDGIEIRHLTHTYSPDTEWAVPALKDVSLTIGRGMVTGIVGGIGSGKSTLACLIAGLDTPTSGSIAIDGRSPKPGGNVRILFQHPEEFFFERTVREAVAFGPSKAGLPDDAVEASVLSAIDEVGLGRGILEKSPFKLSSGEQRLAAFAVSIATKPGYVILDEPTAGLDQRSRKRV
ncbi:MAG TPA: ATP-binding cassette domain-containing protein, partial [Methanosarcinales archaeon]|nr:ATP-binding cassette domain-containing protein [Methanosarcinales archaeon]